MIKSQQLTLQKLASAAPALAAVCRSKSFTKAARELGVHQSAISHKIRNLEEDLGFALFARTTRTVVPTLQGAPICAASATSADALSDALDAVTRIQRDNGTTLSLSSSLAMKWVVPAMPRARALGLRIALNIDDDLTEFGESEVSQAAIRFGPGPYPGLHATVLSHCHAIPVCSRNASSFLSGNDRDTVLLRDTRAEEDGTNGSWEQYFGSDLYRSGRFDTSVTFDRTDVAIQAAIGGLGHALARTLLVEADLEAGILINSGPSKPVRSRYWLVTTPDFAQTDAFKKMAAWLASEVGKSRQILQKHLQPDPYPPTPAGDS
ncbi:LysR family transcriptional regulator [Anderseniella sp. Alg231-50]|uniref:LysR family transcriptional regulator n=1 Tax=Anderseniella sp. Alg231-50 TaxID=1922226 RepID=UPI00307BE76B